MTLFGFFILLLIAAICGSIGQGIAGYSLGGCLASIVVGFVGALIGRWLATKFALPVLFAIHIEGRTFPVVWAIIGSAILSIFIGLLTRGRARRRY